jgi:hypothetical protein
MKTVLRTAIPMSMRNMSGKTYDRRSWNSEPDVMSMSNRERYTSCVGSRPGSVGCTSRSWTESMHCSDEWPSIWLQEINNL